MEVSPLLFYAQAPRPLLWKPRSTALKSMQRVQPRPGSYMEPMMQWASVAQWRQGGAHRGPKVSMVSAERLLRLTEDAEDFLVDEFGELEGDIEERKRSELESARIKQRKARRGATASKKSKKQMKRALLDSADDDEDFGATLGLKLLKKKGTLLKSRQTKKRKTAVPVANTKSKKRTAPASSLKSKKRLRLSLSERTPKAAARDSEDEDFRTPNMEKENDGLKNMPNTAPPAPRKRKPKMRKRAAKESDDPFDLSESEDDESSEDVDGGLSPPPAGGKGRRSIKL